MRQIYLAPRSNETAYKNYVSSMQGRPKSELLPYLSDIDRRKLSGIDVIHAWGCQPNLEPMWDGMKNGDFVLFYAKGRFISVGEVIFKKKSDGLALKLWPRSKDTNEPWSCVFFVDKLQEIDLPLDDFNDLTGYKLGLVRGFMPVRKGLDKIIDEFGSTDNFIQAITTGLTLSSLEDVSDLSNKPLKHNSYEDISKFDDLTRGKDDEQLEESIKNHATNALNKKPEQVTKLVKTYKRNRKLVKDLKRKFSNKCQICEFTFMMSNGDYYSEAAHIIAISTREKGVDSPENIWILCANHHKMLDYGGLKVMSTDTYVLDGKQNKLRTA